MQVARILSVQFGEAALKQLGYHFNKKHDLWERFRDINKRERISYMARVFPKEAVIGFHAEVHPSCQAPQDLVERSKKGLELPMKVPHSRFPGSGLVHYLCDYRKCRGPIVLCWKGRDGDYCSNRCRQAAESTQQEIEPMADEKKKKKKVEAASSDTKKKLKKPAAATHKDGEGKKKKKSKGKAAGRGRSMFDKGAKITIVSKECPFKGNRKEKHKLIKSGMTVGQYLEASREKGFGSSTRPLQRALEAKLIKIA